MIRSITKESSNWWSTWWRIEGNDIELYLNDHGIVYEGAYRSVFCSDDSYDCWNVKVTDEESNTMLKLMSFSR